MAEREITLTEIICVKELGEQRALLLSGDVRALQNYEFEVDLLIETARPEMLAAWKREQEPALFDQTPSPAPLSPSAGDDGAALSPGGAITLSEAQQTAIYRALVQMWADITESHFQPSQHDWPTDVSNYLLRECTRQSEEVPFAEDAHIAQFLTGECIFRDDVQVRKGALYRAYVDWCARRDLAPARERDFAHEISGRGLRDKHSDGAWWVGIGLAPAAGGVAS